MDLRRRSSQRNNEAGKIHVSNRISQPTQRAARDRRTSASTHVRTHAPQSSGRPKNDNDPGNKSTHNMDLRWQQGSTNAPQRQERRIGDSGTHSQRDNYRRNHTSESTEVNPNRYPRLPPQYETNYASQAQTGIGDSGSQSYSYNRSLHMTLPVVLPPMLQPPPPLPFPQPGIINEGWKIPKRKAPNEKALNTSESNKDQENDQHLKTLDWFASRSQQRELCEPQDCGQRSVSIDEQSAAPQMLRPYRKLSKPYDRPQQRGVSVARFNFQEHHEREVSSSDNYGDNQTGSGTMHHIDVLRQDQRRQKDQSYDSRQLTNARSFEHISRNYDDSRKKSAPRSGEFQSSQQSEFQDQHRPEIRQRQEQENDPIHALQQWKTSRDHGQRRVIFRDSDDRSSIINSTGGNLPMSPIPSPPIRPPYSPPPPPPPLPPTSGNDYATKQIPSILSIDLLNKGQANFQSTVNSNQSRYEANTRNSRPMRSKSVMNVKYTQSTSSITAPRFDREAQSSASKTANFVSPRTARLTESAESNSTTEFGQYRGNITARSSEFHSSYPCATVSQRAKGYSQFVRQPQQPRLKVISHWGPETSHEAESTQSHERIRVSAPNSGGTESSYAQPSPKISKQGERTMQELNLAGREILVQDLEEYQARPGSSYQDVGPRGDANSAQNQSIIVTNRSVSDRADVFNASRMPQLASNDRIPVSNFAVCSVRPFGFLSAEDDREHSRETEEYNSEDSHESVATAILLPDRTQLLKIRPEPQIVEGDPNPWPAFTGYPDHIFEHCETEDDERCAREQFELWNPHLFPQKVDIHKEIAQLKAIEDSGAQKEFGSEKSRLDWLHSLSANGGPANFGPNMLDRIVDYVQNLEKSGQQQQDNQPGDEQRILKVIVPNLSQSGLYFQNSASGRVVNFQRSAQDHAER